MEHSLHLGAQHFVEGVAPTPGRAILRKVQEAYCNAQVNENREVNLDQLDDELTGFEDTVGDEGDDGAGDDEQGEPFSIGDTIGKALALVTQV
jgi:hypothetical protein